MPKIKWERDNRHLQHNVQHLWWFPVHMSVSVDDILLSKLSFQGKRGKQLIFKYANFI